MTDLQKLLNCFADIGITAVVRTREYDFGIKATMVFLCSEDKISEFSECDINQLQGHEHFFEFDEDGSLASY